MTRQEPHALIGLLSFAILLGMGCNARPTRPINPCPLRVYSQEIAVDSFKKVDLLFVIDNSNSMEQEQLALAREIPRMVQSLAAGRIGDQIFTPVENIRVGIVTSDMGAGDQRGEPSTATVCADQDGDDGALIGMQLDTNTTSPACRTHTPPYLDFVGGSENVDQLLDFTTQVACLADVGLAGCPFEQPLAALTRAVSPNMRQEGAPNAGFFRDDALLAVVVISDEDDCSADDLTLFQQASPDYAGTPRSHRCGFFDDALITLPSIAAAIAEAKARPTQVVFSAIVGVPPDALVPGESADLDDLLALPEMQNVPLNDREFTPVCTVREITDDPTSTELVKAYPARRIVRLLSELDLRDVPFELQSICHAVEDEENAGRNRVDFAPAISAITRRIATSLSPCLPIPLNPDNDGLVGCEIHEFVPSGECTLPGRELRGYTSEGAARCVVNQTTASSIATPGWYYDETSESCPQRVVFTHEPEFGTEVRLECVEVPLPADDIVDVDTSCARDPGICGDTARIPERTQASFPRGLACEPRQRTCQGACDTSADCPGGYTCHARSPEEPSFCVDPVCQRE